MDVIRHYLTIDGKNSLDFNTWISGGGTFNSPPRDIEKVTIPGRNGELIIDNGRYANIEVSYDAFITKDFDKNISALRAYMGALRGYKVLQDTYDPEHFRLANFSSGLSVETTARNLAGKFTLTFDCKPQRYLKRGEKAYSFPASSGSQWSIRYIKNPTAYNAYPLITVTGSGELVIGSIGVEVAVSGSYTTTIIDCENQEAYYQGVSRNSNITLLDGEFPYILANRENTIDYRGFSTIQIQPRWWTI